MWKKTATARKVLGIILLFALAFACAWLLAAWETYDLPWFDVDPLWGPAP